MEQKKGEIEININISEWVKSPNALSHKGFSGNITAFSFDEAIDKLIKAKLFYETVGSGDYGKTKE